MSSTNHIHFRFPWQEGNHFRLLIDGDQFFPAMLSAIENANHYVALNMYLMASGSVADRFIEALLRAAQRDVLIYITLDDFGANRFNKHDRERLKQPNIHLAFYNPVNYGRWFHNLFRDHRKLLLLDGELAFVGGVGITDDFDPPDEKALRWRETVVEIKGPCVEDWRTLFVESWPVAGITPALLPYANTNNNTEPGTVRTGKKMGRVTLSHAATRQEIRRSVNRHLHAAEHRIWITTAYFVPSWRMQREHTDHPAIRHAGRRFYYRLLQNGVRIFEYQPRFSHSKVLLCDQWSTIGSSNFDRWNLVWNLEANQEIDDQHFARRVQQMFNNDFTQCLEIDVETWRKRPWHRRFLEWYWGWVDALLYKFSMRWRRRNRPRRTSRGNESKP